MPISGLAQIERLDEEAAARDGVVCEPSEHGSIRSEDAVNSTPLTHHRQREIPQRQEVYQRQEASQRHEEQQRQDTPALLFDTVVQGCDSGLLFGVDTPLGLGTDELAYDYSLASMEHDLPEVTSSFDLPTVSLPASTAPLGTLARRQTAVIMASTRR